jgi:capsular polysaccharide biosynthesis protein
MNTEYIYHVEDDIPVKLKNGTNIHENIFIYDKTYNYIQHSTFLSDMRFNLSVDFTQCVNINGPCYLFYSNSMEKAYGHYINELLEKIYNLNILKKKHTFLKIIIPRKYNYEMSQFILGHLGISQKDIMILEFGMTYKFDNILRTSQSTEFSMLSTTRINSINIIRQALNILPNVKPIKKIYIKRDTIINKRTGCYNIGNLRQILNEPELIQYLISEGFSIIELGDKSLIEKHNLLQDAQIVVSANGGNIWNLMFTNTPKHILILCNESRLNLDYIKQSVTDDNIKHNTSCNFNILSYSSIYNNDTENSTNGTYVVNLDEVKVMLSTFN